MGEQSLEGNHFSENRCGQNPSAHKNYYIAIFFYVWLNENVPGALHLSPLACTFSHLCTVAFRRSLFNCSCSFQSTSDTPKTHEELYTDRLLWAGGHVPASCRPVFRHHLCLPTQQHHLCLSARGGAEVIRFVCTIQYSVSLITRVCST